MTKKLNGGCICGRVTYQVEDTFKAFKICHCGLCRKASGSAHVSNAFTSPEALTWTRGEENLSSFDVPNSMVRRVFCKDCGTSLPFVSQNDMFLIVPVGSLEEQPSIQPDEIRSWESRLDWYEHAVDLTVAAAKAS